MKCILCKICEANAAMFWEKHLAWLEAQSNNVAIMEREADPLLVYQAYDLLKTDPAESFRQFLALAEKRFSLEYGNCGPTVRERHRDRTGFGAGRKVVRSRV
jgi:hypothetical protein